MKKLLLGCLLSATAASAMAETYPELNVWDCNFQQGATSVAPFTTWESTGTPSETMGNYVGKGWDIISFNNGTTWAISCSSFQEEGVSADAGLVTPKISLPAEGGLLTFTIMNWNPSPTGIANDFNIYVSETGNQKSDFTEDNLLKNYKLKAATANGPTLYTYTLSLQDYGGKDVYIAFVNNGQNAGGVCITDFSLVKMKAELAVTSAPFVTKAGEYTVKVTATLQTPVSAKGFQAQLLVDGQVYSTYASTRQLNTEYRSYSFGFPQMLNLDMNQTAHYTVNIIPEYEGAPTLSISRTMICAEGFPQTVVEEEGTGVNCGYCPLGAAFMEKLCDQFPDRFVGISVHGGPYSMGAMTAPTYSTQFLQAYNPSGGYPFAILNRSKEVTPNHASSLQASVENLLATRSPIDVLINRADYDENDDKITVTFTPVSSTDINGVSYQAAAVLTASELTGNGSRWTQQNYYSGASFTTLQRFGITTANNDEFEPYYKVYTLAPSSFTNCYYHHVAMGAWPDWQGKGCPLDSEMSLNNPKSYTISFTAPIQTTPNAFGVQDMENTQLCILIFSSQTGEIVAAKQIPYSDFGKEIVSVPDVEAMVADFTIANAAGSLVIAGPQRNAKVEVYTAQGQKIASKSFCGSTTLTPAASGILLVKVTDATGRTTTKKILF